MNIVLTLGSDSCDRAIAEAAAGAGSARGILVVYIVDTSFLKSGTRELHGVEDLENHLGLVGRLIVDRQERILRERGITAGSEVAKGPVPDVVARLVQEQEARTVTVGKDAFHVLDKASHGKLKDAVEQAGAGLRIVE